MVRAVKTSADKAPVVAIAGAIEKVKAPKKVKATKEASVSEPVAAVPAVEGESSEPKVSARLGEYADKITQLSSLVSSMKAEFKSLEKSIAKELKAAEKASQKRKRASGNRAPSGFVKPTLISDELAAFLGKEKGSMIARTAVSKEINNYIRANKLQDPANGRKINADAKLSKLLKLAKTDELTYFNLQKFMKHHFIKTVVATA
jgi:chromatin remodeling complex protein RSC6